MSESDCKKVLIVLVIAAIACLMLDAFSRAPCVCEGAPSLECFVLPVPALFPGLPWLCKWCRERRGQVCQAPIR
jgi:hypothetical protein